MVVNLLYTNEYKFVRSVFNRCIRFLEIKVKNADKNKLRTVTQLNKAVQMIFVFSVHIFHYCRFKNYEDLKLEEFLNKLDDERHVLVPKNIALLTVNFLSKLCLAISLHSYKAKDPKLLQKQLKNVKAFILEIKVYVITSGKDFQFTVHHFQKNTKHTILPLRLFYTYRLTYNDKKQNQKLYYIGMRGSETSATADVNYFSSGGAVKEIIKQEKSTENFTKKILGVFCLKEEALAFEIFYHDRFDVGRNDRFLNRAKQTSVRFQYDRTGGSMSKAGREAISIYQKLTRVRTQEERQSLSQSATKRNSKQAVCPHCGKKGQFVAMQRFHFDRCEQNPDISPEVLAEVRAQKAEISERATKRNISRTGQPNPQQDVTCPHCGKTGKPAAMALWHFDRCPKKPGNPINIRQTVLRPQKLVTCPHCGKVGKEIAMKRWHFDKCPKNPKNLEN